MPAKAPRATYKRKSVVSWAAMAPPINRRRPVYLLGRRACPEQGGQLIRGQCHYFRFLHGKLVYGIHGIFNDPAALDGKVKQGGKLALQVVPAGRVAGVACVQGIPDHGRRNGRAWSGHQIRAKTFQAPQARFPGQDRHAAVVRFSRAGRAGKFPEGGGHIRVRRRHPAPQFY